MRKDVAGNLRCYPSRTDATAQNLTAGPVQEKIASSVRMKEWWELQGVLDAVRI